ncbi:MAG: AraC family transcriptional regulator [Phycisphaeraceae bacterium]|nr:MAG: AraC family transcriptional regulator [Phycisphaeraceae bacterium]
MTSGSEREYAERILRVLVHIQEHLDSALPLDELARIAHFSPFHFHRVFRGMVGEPVAAHVRRLRLERAAQSLKHTGRPIIEIALAAGYESHEAFTRAFGAVFGASPSAFRERASGATEIESASGVHFISASGGVPFTPAGPGRAPMEVEIKAIEPMRVAFLRHTGPYDEVGRTWDALMEWVGRGCHFGPGIQMFGACWDDPEVTPTDKIRYDACVTVGGNVRPEGPVAIQTLGGGRYASVLHEGAYGGLGATYAALMGRWFPSSGSEPGEAPSLEFYLNDPNTTDEEDLLTEVCMPIRF